MKKIVPLAVLLVVLVSLVLLLFPYSNNAPVKGTAKTPQKSAPVIDAAMKERILGINKQALEISNSNSDSAILIGKQALQLAQQVNWEEGLAKTYNLLGLLHSAKGDNRPAFDYYYKALEIENKQDSLARGEKWIAEYRMKTLGNIGVVYMDLGDYPHALDYFFRSLKISDSIQDKEGSSTAFTNIGYVYSEQKHRDKALDYYFRSLKIDRELKDDAGTTISLGDIGVIYNDQGDYAKALYYYEQALQLAQKVGDKDAEAIWLGNMGLVYEKQKADDKALDYFTRALNKANETGNTTTIATQLRAIGAFYSDKKKYREAETHLLQARAMDDSSGALSEFVDDEKYLSDLYAVTGRSDSAFAHYKRYTDAKDSLNNEQRAAQSVRYELTYEFEKKEALQKTKHQEEVIALETQNRLGKATRNFIIISAVLLLVVLSFGLIWWNNRKLLRTKEEFSHQLIITQEKERQRISRELHDSIGQNMLFIKNQLTKQDQPALVASVNEALEEVRSISKDLYPNQLERYGLAAAIDALAEKVQESSSIFVSHDLEAFNREISPEQQINYYRIIQECITNTLKHSEATALRITAATVNGMIELIVQDNGKGFDKATLAKKAQRSFGLLNIEERVSYLKGRFELQTAPGKGTKYIFHLPV